MVKENYYNDGYHECGACNTLFKQNTLNNQEDIQFCVVCGSNTELEDYKDEDIEADRLYNEGNWHCEECGATFNADIVDTGDDVMYCGICGSSDISESD